jgi:hypothetical protein
MGSLKSFVRGLLSSKPGMVITLVVARPPRGGQGVGDARARRKPVHAGVRDGARDVHDDRRLGRPGGRRGVLDHHDRLTVA